MAVSLLGKSLNNYSQSGRSHRFHRDMLSRSKFWTTYYNSDLASETYISVALNEIGCEFDAWRTVIR